MPRFEISGSHRLRLLEESDAKELHALIDANRAYLARWMPWAQEQTAEQTLAFILATREQLAGNNGFQLALTDQQRIVGVLGFHSVDWVNRATSLGYWLAESAQGQGLVTEAVSALIDHALRGWQLNRVEIRAAVENLRSRAIPERLGFKQEGTLRQTMRLGDRYLDHVVYSMLASDWPR
ncbi:MAG TPA: GNAT family protein [Solirubrobacteraceae bacterium]